MLSLKELLVKHENRVILFIGVVLLSLTSYGLGRLSAPQPKEPIKIEAKSGNILKEDKQNKEASDSQKPADDEKAGDVTPAIKAETKPAKPISAPSQSQNGEGIYVASKNGTKYHLPSCSGAKRIKEENKVWFNSKAEAEQAGYEPAKNCKGI